jgi:hypothetical protein
MVNPLSDDQLARLHASGGPNRALAWVLDGLPSIDMKDLIIDRASLVEDLVAKGLPRDTAEKMAEVAEQDGQVETADPTADLGANRADALDQATAIAGAMLDGRTNVQSLIASTDERSALGLRYRGDYTLALHRAGLQEIDLLDRFPVLVGNFGYTRGASTPGQSTLRLWRDRRSNQYLVHADLLETEALFVRLDPMRVAEWLRRRGHPIDPVQNPKEARQAILAEAEVPMPGEERDSRTVGTDLLTLVHAYAHRFIRQAAVFAGLDRNSLSELLVPLHLGFFVYASSRGDFVLGGLQALFETELDRLLGTITRGEQRCPMDPGCRAAGGACVACLHLGEPSCRYFNRFLSRGVLFGDAGYLTMPE